MKAQAPWDDFEGKALYEGDQIVHPSGERGTIIFDRSKGPLAVDCWLVDYGDGDLSRLILQVGDKGRAIKLSGRQK